MHRLCLELGYTISELVERMSLKELTEWMLFYQKEPWGASLDGIRMASNTAAIYNVNLPREKKVKPEDFFIGVNSSKPKKEMGWQEVKNTMGMIFQRKVNNDSRGAAC